MAHTKAFILKKIVVLLIGVLGLLSACDTFADIKIAETEEYKLSISPSFRLDGIGQTNTIDLDSKKHEDNVAYLAYEYAFEFALSFKDEGPKAYAKVESIGLYDYDAPLASSRDILTLSGKMKDYRGSALLPKLNEFWFDTPVPFYKFVPRVKAGLFKYSVGHNFAVNGSYENYGASLYYDYNELFTWTFYYCYPDAQRKYTLGPYIKQEKPQGVDYEHSKANLFATDIEISLGGESVIQPYVSMLIDKTGERRNSFFATPTHDDILGTMGISSDISIARASFEIEAVRNFGQAASSDEAYPDVEHCGWLFYSGAGYDLEYIKPHGRFLYVSGNRVETDMVTNGDSVITSGKNNAFSVFSPFNSNLADSVYPGGEIGPILAMGAGYGVNYGVARPGTFNDPGMFDNMITFCFGFDQNITDKISLTVDWWRLRTAEPGIGIYEGSAKKLSPFLGDELDIVFNWDIDKNISVYFFSGFFLPGQFYKEERDDTDGSLFTPFVRGDGEADAAYQFELVMSVKI